MGAVCQVIELGTKAIVPCSFPFILNETRFDSCTDYLDPDGKLWCSTKTNPKTMEHGGGAGSWGFCTNEFCPTAEVKIETTAVTALTKATTARPVVTTDADSISEQKIIDSLLTNHIEIRVEFKDKKTAWKNCGKSKSKREEETAYEVVGNDEDIDEHPWVV